MRRKGPNDTDRIDIRDKRIAARVAWVKEYGLRMLLPLAWALVMIGMFIYKGCQ